ncbi:kinase-like domain-containing protein [Mycena amicta]|nr:kinase-like domain-containing protein [Mycena amicta]
MDALLQLSGVTPIPGLDIVFQLFSSILVEIPRISESRKQVQNLSEAVATLLKTINAQFVNAQLLEIECAEPLADLTLLLEDIAQFARQDKDKSFFRLMLSRENRLAKIARFYERIGLLVDTFQLSAMINVSAMTVRDGAARAQDAQAMTGRLQSMEHNQNEMRQALELNANNMLSLLLTIQHRLDSAPSPAPNTGLPAPEAEHRFYARALEYLNVTTPAAQRQSLIGTERWMISSFEVEFDEGGVIGRGGFGTVYRGSWNRTEVAIKVVHDFGGIRANNALLRKEIDVWLDLRHPNILQFLGANTIDETPFIVMPFLPSNAREYLAMEHQLKDGRDPIYIIRDVSLGLEYLHSRNPPVVHGDLKGINILVNELGRGLLCDFGLSKIKADITSRTTAATTSFASAGIGGSAKSTTTVPTSGSRNWMAPELLAGSSARFASDVYAFGMTIYELYTDTTPFSTLDFSDFLEVVWRLGIRPERPDPHEAPKLIDVVWRLVERCWVKEGRERPSVREMGEAVTGVIRDQERRAQGTSNSNPAAMHSRMSSVPAPPSLPSLSKPPSGPSAFVARQRPPPVQQPGGSVMSMQGLQYPSMSSLQQALQATHLNPGSGRLPGYNTSISGTSPTTQPPPSVSTSTSTSENPNTSILEEMAQHQRTIVTARTNSLGPMDPETLKQKFSLAGTYHQLGHYAEAAALASSVLDARRQVLGNEHNDTLGSMFSLAGTYHKLRRFDEAKALVSEVLRMRMKTLGKDDKLTLVAMYNLVVTHVASGKVEDSDGMLEMAMELVERQSKVLGPGHEDTKKSMKLLDKIMEMQRA